MREQVGARNHQLRRGRAMPPGARGVIVAVVTALALAVSYSARPRGATTSGREPCTRQREVTLRSPDGTTGPTIRVYRPLK